MFSKYTPSPFYCEMFGKSTTPLSHAQKFADNIATSTPWKLAVRSDQAQQDFFNKGVTFTLYSGNTSTDRVLPFDVIPRIIAAEEWQQIERGSIQRVKALNKLIYDLYHGQKILKDGVIPKDLILKNKNFRREMQAIEVPENTYVHICGIDLIRDGEGVYRVLEDNARTPSGVSYVLENRNLMLRNFPDLMQGIKIHSVADYGQNLRKAFSEVAPPSPSMRTPEIVILSPGVYNSAYFEHVFLAQEMGITLVEGRDLVVKNDSVYMKTTSGLTRVDVIYRRLDDDFLDPEVFRPDSMLGVHGLMRAYRKGNVTICNAVGTGCADDKAVYAYMPRVIEYYLGEKAILPNVETHICREREALQYTLDNLEKLVVKPVGESGGYGLVIGPKSTKEQLDECRKQLIANPDNFISQPVMNLSVCPTLVEGNMEPRHVDLRPFVITGKDSWVLPGGLTRVALTKGSLVVNSSQGGGSKDTWVLEA
jgi:uncharacterized circularly permuted ATP-grasp superfamily protein